MGEMADLEWDNNELRMAEDYMWGDSDEDEWCLHEDLLDLAFAQLLESDTMTTQTITTTIDRFEIVDVSANTQCSDTFQVYDNAKKRMVTQPMGKAIAKYYREALDKGAPTGE